MDGTIGFQFATMLHQTSSSSAGQNSDPPELRIVLIGGRHGSRPSRKSGKSSVGNIILGRHAFDRITSKSIMRQALVSGRQISVVDTPGWRSHYPLNLTPKLTQLEIQHGVSVCTPGHRPCLCPHAFLLVVRLDSPHIGTGMSAEEHVKFLLSDRAWKHAIVVFTVADKKNMKTDLIRSDPELRYLTEKCEGRYHVVDISGMGGRGQVAELLQKVDQMMQSNGGHYETEKHVSEELKEKHRTIGRRAEQRRTAAHQQPTGPPKHIRGSDLRIVMLGRQYSGKSSAGNTILTGTDFRAGHRSVQCEVRQGHVAGRHVTVVDSPGWFYNSPLQNTSEMDKLQIQDSVYLCTPGPHAVLLTVPLREAKRPPSQETQDVLLHAVTLCSPGPHAVLVMVDVMSSFCEADRRSVEEHMELLGDRVWRHALVLFMFGHWLGERRVEEYIEAEGEPLRRILERCGYMYHVLHGVKWDISEVKQLMEKIELMVTRNGGHFKSDESFYIQSDESRMTTPPSSLYAGVNTGGVSAVKEPPVSLTTYVTTPESPPLQCFPPRPHAHVPHTYLKNSWTLKKNMDSILQLIHTGYTINVPKKHASRKMDDTCLAVVMNTVASGMAVNMTTNFSGKGAETGTKRMIDQIRLTDFYTLSHNPVNPRGTCLIINNEMFTLKTLKTRRGTLEDEEGLERVFSKLGFEVEIRTNKTANDIRCVVKELGRRDFTEADALVVCVLSHGDKGCVFGSDGEKVFNEELMEPFTSSNAPTLAGKPKLFFIQACQGTGYQRGAMSPPLSPSGGEGDSGQSQVQGDSWISCPEVIPNDADFLIGMATVPECQSFRDTRKGSIYIQALCKQLETAAKRGEDILGVLTAVNREVSRGQYKDCKQMPEWHGRLTKKLILKFIRDSEEAST